MEFVLTYEGTLLSERTEGRKQAGRATHKQAIRKALHPQLKRLWEITPVLFERTAYIGKGAESRRVSYQDYLAETHQRDGYRYCPLVTSALEVYCNLSILLLRPAPVGSVSNKGDIDNRLKTLVDGLRMADNQCELGDYKTPAAGEDPFFCLLENDRLISNLSIETGTLLDYVEGSLDENSARAIIKVKVWPIRPNMDNLGFI